MNILCTLLTNLADNTSLLNQDINNLHELITSVVKLDLNGLERIVKNATTEKEGDTLHFTCWMTPNWLEGTPDNKQVKLVFGICQSDMIWRASAVIDSDNGELDDWGCAGFSRTELEKYAHPVDYILSKIKQKYDCKVMKENGKQCKEIDKVIKVIDLLEPYVKKITDICKKKKVQLYCDHSIEGTNVLYVVPNSIEVGDPKPNDKVIDTEMLPYIDLNARGFDPGYDSFILTK